MSSLATTLTYEYLVQLTFTNQQQVSSIRYYCWSNYIFKHITKWLNNRKQFCISYVHIVHLQIQPVTVH